MDSMSRKSLGESLSAQYICQNSKLLAPVVYFAGLVYSKVPIICTGTYASLAVHTMYCQNCPMFGTYNRSFRVLENSFRMEEFQNNFFQTTFHHHFWDENIIFRSIILLTSSKNQIYEFRITNIYNYFFNNTRLMYTLCFLVASVKLKVYKKVVKFSFKQQKILGIRNS